MSDFLTSIRLPGSGGIAEWGVLSKEDMIKKVRDYFYAQKLEAEKYLDAKDTDFEISVIKGSSVQRHIKWIQKPPSPYTAALGARPPDSEKDQADGKAIRKVASGAAVSPAQEPCQTCGGDGDINQTEEFIWLCPDCNGTGKRCDSDAVKGV